MMLRLWSGSGLTTIKIAPADSIIMAEDRAIGAQVEASDV
jgi:hypothetical protein